MIMLVLKKETKEKANTRRKKDIPIKKAAIKEPGNSLINYNSFFC